MGREKERDDFIMTIMKQAVYIIELDIILKLGVTSYSGVWVSVHSSSKSFVLMKWGSRWHLSDSHHLILRALLNQGKCGLNTKCLQCRRHGQEHCC